jgi:DNA-binding SARP family transcriptional activator
MVEFRILGPLEVVDDGRRVVLGGQRQRALLGLLLVRAGQVVSTDKLVDELWGEEPPRTAKNSLQNLVVQLRRLLGQDVLLTRPPGYVLQVDPAQLDLGRFEQLVAQARKVDPAEKAAKLRDALTLWRGSPLADLAFESFALTETRRLEELRLEVLEERIEADLALGAGAELVAEVEGLVSEFPLREKLRAQLMLALYRSGRQAEALDAYHAARRTLSDELGIDPSPQLQQLYGQILRQEGALEPSARARAATADPYADVVKALLTGRLVPILGTGVNNGGDGGRAVPGLAEAAAYLAESFECPPEHERDLARVSEYVALTKGVGPLYDELHTLYDRDYEPGATHRLLADTASRLRERGLPLPLIVTTNFDVALERAFSEASQEFDVVSYIAIGRHRGKFLHVPCVGDAVVVEVPNSYTGLALGERTVILKIHGQVDRQPDREWESFVVSEDDHIDYLAQAEISNLVPVTLVAKLRRSHFLFLGYPLSDWGLRVFLHRVFGREQVSYRSWAIERQPEAVVRELWSQRGIDVFDVPLDEYVQELSWRIVEGSR